MFLTVVTARDLNEAWFKLLKECLDAGHQYTVSGGSTGAEGHQRKELDCVAIEIVLPHARPLVPDVPDGVPPPASMDFVEAYLPKLISAIKDPNESYTYGEDVEPQFLKIISMYKQDGFNTNQACISVGDRNSINLADPQCLRVIDTRVRYGRLHWYVYFRSWDLWGGFPANMAALQLAKEIMAKELGVGSGRTLAFSKGLHLYDWSWDLARKVLRYE